MWGAVDGELMKNLIVFEINDRGIPSKVVFAKSGTISPDNENNRLLLRVKDAHFEQRDDLQPDNVDLIRQGITMREGVFPMSIESFLEQKSWQTAECPHPSGTARRNCQTRLPAPSCLRGRGEQAILPFPCGTLLCADRGSSRDHRPSQGDLGGLRAEPGDCVWVFFLHYHCRHLSG